MKKFRKIFWKNFTFDQKNSITYYHPEPIFHFQKIYNFMPSIDCIIVYANIISYLEHNIGKKNII